MLRIIHLCIFIFYISLLQGQVRDIKESAKDDDSKTAKSSFYDSGESYSSQSSSNSYDDYSAGDSFEDGLIDGMASFVFYGIGMGIVQGQKASLENIERYPDRKSFDLGVLFGADVYNRTSLLQPYIRGNYGILSSEMRFSALNDVTGYLHNWDWQVLIFRIPIQNFKPEFGLGFTHLSSPQKTWFETSMGFEWSLLHQKMIWKSNYRWTSIKSDEERFRQAVSTSISYDVICHNGFHFAPVLGYVYQSYYGTHNYNMVQVGLKVRLF